VGCGAVPCRIRNARVISRRGGFFQLWWIELVLGDRISSVKFWLGNLLEGRWLEVLKWGVEQSLVVSETRELSHVEGFSFRS
jgi:hypothetical protein